MKIRTLGRKSKMKMRMKENVELGIRESYLGVHGSITLRTGDVFEVTKMCGGLSEKSGLKSRGV